MIPPPPRSTLFPYTTLFRSLLVGDGRRRLVLAHHALHDEPLAEVFHLTDRKSTRLNSSHLGISYAVFCLKKKTKRLQLRRKQSATETTEYMTSSRTTSACRD